VSRGLRIAPIPATALADDDPRLVAPADVVRLHPVPGASDRWLVATADGAPATAVTRPLRRRLDGVATIAVVVDGWRFELEVEDADRADLRRRATRAPDAGAASGPMEIRAIIPGRVAAVRVVVGDAVEAGQSLLVVEAMKMQNELRAPRAGVVERVEVGEGQTIDNGDLLVVLR
jgi:biotin carboxyl carrier protein